ncbi:MAG TPA: SDR family oxidoreductase [Bacteroidales bacterium]|nr:SDR family oxidoreductase [Bacteroidales bacterium]
MEKNYWAIILGGSSGMGLASAKMLAQKGYHLFLVHRDGRIGTKSFIDDIEKWKPVGIQIITLNANANTLDGKEQIKQSLNQLPKNSVKVFLHSVADGHIKPLFGENNSMNEEDLLYTIQSMGISFATWTQWLFNEHLLAPGAQILGFTSDGSHKVIPHYAAVGAAKAVLETLCRYMAVELAPHDISVNLLCPGVVNTKAIRVFPNANEFIEKVSKKNPHQRLTTPDDVAQLIMAIIDANTSWLTGEIIHIDGGEQHVF